MSIESHMQALAEKREDLKHQIAEEMNHPSPNFTRMTELKKTEHENKRRNDVSKYSK